MYWTFTTVSTTGYGDIVPNTIAERIFSMGTMMLGLTVFSYVISSVSSVMQMLAASSLRASEQRKVGAWNAWCIYALERLVLSGKRTSEPCWLLPRLRQRCIWHRNADVHWRLWHRHADVQRPSVAHRSRAGAAQAAEICGCAGVMGSTAHAV
jgi:hypothetical protein